MKDLKSNVDAKVSINPGVHNSDQTGSTVDLSGCNSAIAVIMSGTLTDGTHTPKLQESDDDSSWSDVSSDDIEGTMAALGANAVVRHGYKGAKRYVRVYVTSTGTTGCAYGACVIRGDLAINPAS